jgi:hypothetical protein
VETVATVSVFLFLGIAWSIPFLVVLMKERYRHREICLAVEKGLDPSEIRAIVGTVRRRQAPSWIRQVGVGLFLMLLGVASLVRMGISGDWSGFAEGRGSFWITILSLAAGGMATVMGLLARNSEQRRAKNGEPA